MRPFTLADIAKADEILRSEGVSPTLIPDKRLIHLILTSGAGIAALFEDIPESRPPAGFGLQSYSVHARCVFKLGETNSGMQPGSGDRRTDERRWRTPAGTQQSAR